MFFRAIKSLFALLPYVTQQGAADIEKKREKPRILDMMEARFLSEEARKRNVSLSALLRRNRSELGHEELRQDVGKKVDRLIAPFYRHPDIMDEVTEKLVDVAVNDPFYKRWFS